MNNEVMIFLEQNELIIQDSLETHKATLGGAWYLRYYTAKGQINITEQDFRNWQALKLTPLYQALTEN
jgi:hypothetical protein